MKKYATIIALVATIGSTAQVGINNPLPDSTAVLDLSGSANELRGVLFPLAKDLSLVGAGTAADGLIVRDSISEELYIYYSAGNNWHSVNSWREIENTNVIYTLNKNVGIGIQAPLSPLHVTGDIRSDAALRSDSIRTKKIYALGDVTVGPVGRIRGNGAVPQGAILMWSGAIADIPDGWALCDGTIWLRSGAAYDPGTTFPPPPVPPGATYSPDLTGRFVVGYDPADTDYNTIGNIDGRKDVTLTAAQSGLPSHTHTYSGTTSSNGGHTHTIPTTDATSAGMGHAKRRASTSAGTITTSSNGAHTHTYSGTTASTGGTNASQAHENRPPYYTLAYIIKLF